MQNFRCFCDDSKQRKYDDTCDLVYPMAKFNQSPYWYRWLKAKFHELTTNDPLGVHSMKPRHEGTISDWWKLIIGKNEYRDNFIKKWKDQNLDIVICPVIACPAFSLGLDRIILSYVTYTSIFNTVNMPAGTVPVTRVTKEDIERTSNPKYFQPEHVFEHMIAKDAENSENLPVGVQVVGLPFQEEMVLRVMSELEQALKVKV